MQFLTAKTLSYIRVACLVTISYLLVKDPEFLGNLGFVLLLGQAMEVPYAKLDKANPLVGAAAVVFASLALSDLIPLMADNIAYFETVVPTRLTMYFGIAAYSYLDNKSAVSNSLIFTYAFFEIWFNFLIYNNLRDEKYYRMKKFVEEHGEKLQRAHDEQVRIVEIDE